MSLSINLKPSTVDAFRSYTDPEDRIESNTKSFPESELKAADTSASERCQTNPNDNTDPLCDLKYLYSENTT